jgi:hypothetical protein
MNRISRLVRKLTWGFRQRLARPGRYYGREGTIHRTGYVDVETCGDRVVAVWFRCQPLSFRSREVDGNRASKMFRMYREHPAPEILGVEVKDNG